jgi:predicted metal-dependent hydrolase
MAEQGEARQIRLKGQLVEYSLRRRARRTLGLRIDARGLVVSIPQRVSIAQAELFLVERADWVLSKLAEWATRPKPASFEVADGIHFPMLGQRCRLQLSHGQPAADWVQGIDSRELHLRLRARENPRTALLRAIQHYALGYFGGRIEEYAWALQQCVPGIQLPRLALTNARTRWGSCSRISGIRLNWRLIHLPNAQIDYVVAHELAHLVEMNHSARFWQVVELMYPEHREAQAALRQAHSIIPAW